MVDKILQAAQASTYDFRKTAFADDPLSDRFDDWVPYYRLKWAIAKVLAPRRILEIGVRYGYSALAFLDACPSARYVGIDLDVNQFGGVRGSIHWAQSKARRYDAQFMIANSQLMTTYPGGRYDLIHVDGQQDGAGSVHDISVALRQAEYVLVDGFFWTSENFWYISECLLRYRDLIEFCVIVPGYAGELLIKTRADAKGCPWGTAKSSRDLQTVYTRDFYLNRLRGSDDFMRYRARILTTPWHIALGLLAEAAPAGDALDIGCGRGELTVCLARQGRHVTAVDFSSDAIQLATAAVADSRLPGASVRFLHADLNEVQLEGKFQVIVASDIIQRLSEEELTSLLARAAEHLEPSGLLLLSGRPNAWYLRYALPAMRRQARRLGAHLPSMHLNDAEAGTLLNPPSPSALNRRLKGLFRHSAVWFGNYNGLPDGIFPSPSMSVSTRPPHSASSGGLKRILQHSAAWFRNYISVSNGPLRSLSKSGLKEAPLILAAASNGPLESLLSVLRMEALPLSVADEVRIKFSEAPDRLAVGSCVLVGVALENKSGFSLRSVGGHAVHLSYHWLDESGESTIVRDGMRTVLVPSIPSAGSGLYWLQVQAPDVPGTYFLRVTLVQERVFWFDLAADRCCAMTPIHVE
ncbi:MAG: methyltransferase domain-containing protein [Acidobacteriales bacterium]|nr:methyltransferase domain-containing protein [Terriglobales bacterium]